MFVEIIHQLFFFLGYFKAAVSGFYKYICNIAETVWVKTSIIVYSFCIFIGCFRPLQVFKYFKMFQVFFKQFDCTFPGI